MEISLFGGKEGGICGECRHFQLARGSIQMPYGYCARNKGNALSDMLERARLHHVQAKCSVPELVHGGN